MFKVGIVGANGYTGGELIRLLHKHPEVTIHALASRSQAAGKPGSFSQLCTAPSWAKRPFWAWKIPACTNATWSFWPSPMGLPPNWPRISEPQA